MCIAPRPSLRPTHPAHAIVTVGLFSESKVVTKYVYCLTPAPSLRMCGAVSPLFHFLSFVEESTEDVSV